MSRIKKTDYNEWEETPTISRMGPSSEEVHIVRTPLGHIVCVLYEWPYTTYTRMEFISDGRLWVRVWERGWAPRTITTLARQFAEEKSNV